MKWRRIDQMIYSIIIVLRDRQFRNTDHSNNYFGTQKPINRLRGLRTRCSVANSVFPLKVTSIVQVGKLYALTVFETVRLYCFWLKYLLHQRGFPISFEYVMYAAFIKSCVRPKCFHLYRFLNLPFLIKRLISILIMPMKLNILMIVVLANGLHRLGRLIFYLNHQLRVCVYCEWH